MGYGLKATTPRCRHCDRVQSAHVKNQKIGGGDVWWICPEQATDVMVEMTRFDAPSTFHLGAFSFPILLEACGYLWPCIHSGSRWYCAFGTDPRMPEGDDYPALLSNSGFVVTAEEARILARVARNFVAIQRTLPDPTPEELAGAGVKQKTEFRREDVQEMLMRAMGGSGPETWPLKIRADFTDQFERFAAWAERSGGFEIW